MANGLFNLKQVVQAVQQGGWPAQKTPAVEYLIVAGGGGGGYTGGGGAGGLLTGLDPVPNGQTLLVTVGGGGAGSTGGSDNAVKGSASVFGSLNADGGGAGFLNYTPTIASKNSGGSGGGGGISGITNGQNTAGQGNAGGLGSATNGGGGGGAGSAGVNATGRSGNGGSGIASAISGTVTPYAGGGGGGMADSINSNFALGGSGGGGNATSTTGQNGTTNTGGGGGGASFNGPSSFYSGGTGGSGIAIVSYPDVYAAPIATTGSPTVSTSGSGSIYNAGAGTVQFTGTATPFTFTGDFTIEGWYNLANFNNAAGGGNPSLVSSGSTGNWLVGIPGGTYVFYSGGALVLQTAAVASANVWNHFAVVRSGTTVTIYHNGSSVGTATLGSTVTGAATTTVTANGTGGVGSITGYMSNVRIVRGTAVYTGAFTPSTIPLTAITNTQLLMNAVSGGFLVDGSVNSFTPTTSSTSLAWNQLSPFTGVGYKNRVYTWTSSGSITF
jgi:hypothetical protein